MRRVLPLCVILGSAGLLLAGVWTSLAVAAPTPTTISASDSAQVASARQANPDARWVETFGDPPPKKSP